MSDEIPSPAGARRPQPRSSENGPAQLPWESALYDAVRALERRAAAAEAEQQRLFLVNEGLRQKLYEAKRRLDNWELRRQAWKRERDELLQRLERLNGR